MSTGNIKKKKQCFWGVKCGWCMGLTTFMASYGDSFIYIWKNDCAVTVIGRRDQYCFDHKKTKN
jgi:hypothetical protein